MKSLPCHVLCLVLLLPGTAGIAFGQIPYSPRVPDSLIVARFLDESGREVEVINISGKPPDLLIARATALPSSATGVGGVPAYDWSFGCSPTSASMLAAYYDSHGYPNIYTGPTNGGVMPLNNSAWGSIVINSETRKQCPLSATRNGLDGRTTRGHVDDYWVKYGSTALDPYITNGWTEHVRGECLADYMRTNQSLYLNSDGSTRFYYSPSGDPYRGTNAGDGAYGMELFFQSRGYTVTERFTQLILGYDGNANGFTFSQYMQEIDAGRPVLIQMVGHTMLGFGYDDADSTIYIHDTWDYNDHSMKWGSYYYDTEMTQWGVVVLHLSPAASIAVTSPAGGENWPAGSTQTVTWTSLNSPGPVSIFLSRDGGITFPDTLAWNIADDGSEQVTIPPAAATTSALVRIAFVTDPTNRGESPGLFSIYTPTTHQIALAAGWNLVSSYVYPLENSLTVFLSSLSGNLVILKNGTGQVYWPAYGINQIGSWNTLQGYLIYLSSPAILAVNGRACDPQTTPIPLGGGWNIVSYLSASSRDIVQALNSIQDVLVIAKNGQGQVYWPAYSINTIGSMVPGQGYSLYVTHADTLLYPAASLGREVSRTWRAAAACSHFTGMDQRGGSSAILVWRSLPFPDGDEIAVLTADGQLAGSGTVQGEQAVITIWGGDLFTADTGGAVEGAPLSLRRWSQGEQREISVQPARILDGLTGRPMTNLEYTRDSALILEGIAESEEVTIREFQLQQNYPNPFNMATVIDYTIPRAQKTDLTVYNLKGERIRNLERGFVSAGKHRIIWDGRDEAGMPLPTGLYIVRCTLGMQLQTIKAMLMK
jgi:hypothetical protein